MQSRSLTSGLQARQVCRLPPGDSVRTGITSVGLLIAGRRSLTDLAGMLDPRRNVVSNHLAELLPVRAVRRAQDGKVVQYALSEAITPAARGPALRSGVARLSTGGQLGDTSLIDADA